MPSQPGDFPFFIPKSASYNSAKVTGPLRSSALGNFHCQFTSVDAFYCNKCGIKTCITSLQSITGCQRSRLFSTEVSLVRNRWIQRCSLDNFPASISNDLAIHIVPSRMTLHFIETFISSSLNSLCLWDLIP